MTPSSRRPSLLATIATVAVAIWLLASLAANALASSGQNSRSAGKAAGYPAFNAPPFLASGGRDAAARGSLLEEVLSASGSDQICRPTGQIEDACCDYETVEKSLNTPKFYQTLVDLVQTNYFRYYKVDLFKDCPFWVENGLCMNRACGVEKASESEIPIEYRSNQLSVVSTADQSEIVFSDGHDKSSNSCQCRDSDFCHWEDEETSSEASWVDLIKNPERFTGYAGPGANRVWKAIYEENCFGAVPKGSFLEPPRAKAFGGSGFVSRGDVLFGGPSGSSRASNGLSGGLDSLMPNLAAPVDPAASEQCLEKRVFYRVISGLHASISTHICHDYLNQTTGEWSPNLECFVSRIAQHPERLQNVYFNYVLLVRALARAGDYLTSFNLKPGHTIPASEERTLSLLGSLVSQANECPPTFDEASMFQPSNPEAPQLKTEFREHFRNVSAIMDCVGCDKCRLWGKMQVNGLGTAMKILFSFDEADFDPTKNPALLDRSELVALINTLHRFAESLKAVETFREMYQRETLSKKRHQPVHASSGDGGSARQPGQAADPSSGAAQTSSSSLPGGVKSRHAGHRSSAVKSTEAKGLRSDTSEEPFGGTSRSALQYARSIAACAMSSAVQAVRDCMASVTVCARHMGGLVSELYDVGRQRSSTDPLLHQTPGRRPSEL